MALTSQITTSLLQVDGRMTEGGVIEIVPGARLLLDVGVEDIEPGALLDEIATAVAEAQAARDEAVDISGISTSDAVIASRIETPGTATQTALSATIATEVEPVEAVAGAANTAARRGRALTRAKVGTTGGAAGITATITAAAGSLVTDITSPVEWGALTYIRYTCCGLGAPTVVAGVGYKGPKARGGSGGDVWGDDAQDAWVYAPDGVLEIMTQVVQSGYQYLRLYADGVLVLESLGLPYAADQRYRIKLVLDAARSKTVHLRWVGSLGTRHIYTGQNGLVWKPDQPIYRALGVLIGDSFGAMANDTAYTKPFGGYLRRLGEQFGHDLRRCAYSQTGLTTNGGGTNGRTSYLDRVAEAKTYATTAPDYGILQLSTNDGGASQAAITTAMTTFVTNWRTQYTRADGTCPPLFVVGVARGIPAGPSTVNCDAIDNGVKAVMDANPDLFPLALVSTAGWWTGNGHAGLAATSTPKGTTELGISADGLHPTDVGHDYMADRIAPHFAKFLALIDLA